MGPGTVLAAHQPNTEPKTEQGDRRHQQAHDGRLDIVMTPQNIENGIQDRHGQACRYIRRQFSGWKFEVHNCCKSAIGIEPLPVLRVEFRFNQTHRHF
jgi:hypothetical protein